LNKKANQEKDKEKLSKSKLLIENNQERNSVPPLNHEQVEPSTDNKDSIDLKMTDIDISSVFQPHSNKFNPLALKSNEIQSLNIKTSNSDKLSRPTEQNVLPTSTVTNISSQNLNLSTSLPTFDSILKKDFNNQNSKTKNLYSNSLSQNRVPVLQFSNMKPLEPTRNQQLINKNECSTKSSNSRQEEINNNKNNSNNLNNLKDLYMFDSGSSDPFNEMELKTINEFEELKNILNNQTYSTVINQQQQNQLTPSSSSNLPTLPAVYVDTAFNAPVFLNNNTSSHNQEELTFSLSASPSNLNTVKSGENFAQHKISFMNR
jgi:hypothetical protein